MHISSLWQRDHPSPTTGKVRFVSAGVNFDIPPVLLCLTPAPSFRQFLPEKASADLPLLPRLPCALDCVCLGPQPQTTSVMTSALARPSSEPVSRPAWPGFRAKTRLKSSLCFQHVVQTWHAVGARQMCGINENVLD